jgi:hypothetical protein
MKCLVAFGVLGLITTACGTEQSPSFTEKRDSKTIRLTVEGDPEKADEESTSRESLDEMDVGAVLDAAYDDTAPSGNGDSPTGTGGSTGSVSGGSPSSSDATAATDGSGIIVASADGSASADLADASVTGGSAADSGATSATPDDGNEGELGLPTSGGTTTGSGDEGAQGSGAGSSSTGPTAGGSSTSDGSTGGSTSDGSTSGGSTGGDMPTEGELRACAKLQGVSVDRVKVAGNQNNMSLTSSSVAAIKITGNQNSVSLMLAGAADARLAGVCIFLAGNQARIDVDVGLNLERLVYVARGNQSHGELALSGNGTIGAMAVDLSGNGASLHISGDGAASICDAAQVRQKGKGTKLLCN